MESWVYEKRFAYLPVLCFGHDKRIWLKSYYKKYLVYTFNDIRAISFYMYSLTAQDTVIEKLRNS